MKTTLRLLIPIALVVAFAACGSNDSTTAPDKSEILGLSAAKDNPNGAGGQRPVYYDDLLFTVNMKEVSDDEEEKLGNAKLAEIFAYADLDEEQPFLSVIDAIPGEPEFSPLWEQFLIQFNGGPPHQFTSEEDIDAAVASGEITLIETEEIYRCSVVGQKASEEDE